LFLFYKRYEKFLAIAKDEGIKKGIFTGLTIGFIMLVIDCGFALGSVCISIGIEVVVFSHRRILVWSKIDSRR
jgi:hypothetical protein